MVARAILESAAELQELPVERRTKNSLLRSAVSGGAVLGNDILAKLKETQEAVEGVLRRAANIVQFTGGVAIDSIVGLPEYFDEEPPLRPEQGTLVFLPGFFAPVTSMRAIMQEGRARGYNTRAIGLNLNFPSITENAEHTARQLLKLQNEIDRLKNGKHIPAEVVGLIGYSMGGLVARKALAGFPLDFIFRVFLLGTPNNGTVLARNIPLQSCREASSEEFLAALNRTIDPRFLSIAAADDELVPQERSRLGNGASNDSQNVVLEAAHSHHALIKDPLALNSIYTIVDDAFANEFQARRLV